MSTKAEIQRLKARRKRLGIIAKVIGCILLLVLGIVYCSGLSNEKKDIGTNGSGVSVEKKTEDNKSKTFELVDNSSTNEANVTEILTKSVTLEEGEDFGTDLKAADETTVDVSTVDETTVDDPVQKPGIDKNGKVNINTASVSELCTLNGIGEKRANDIIEYRETFGYFKNIEDIMKVKGIKQGIFSKIKDKITCE